MSKGALLLEEKLAFEFARLWREPAFRPDLERIDWERFAGLLTRNRMSVLALRVLDRAGETDRIPVHAAAVLDLQADKYRRAASTLGGALAACLDAADAAGVETIVLKGLWLCEKIYGDPSLRPGGDIDLLVRRGQVDACLRLLEHQGIGAFWPNLLNDEYFSRHHLHQQRSSPDLRVWFEIHWALDHPYTLLTVDYDGLFARTQPGSLLGSPVRDMSPPDLLLSLAIHLVKHAVYLPGLWQRPDLARILLADGMLMYYLDVTEAVKKSGPGLDWDQTVRLARQWGAVDLLGSVLRTCRLYLNAPIPGEVLAALPVTGPSPLTRRMMARAADQELAAYEGRTGSRFWDMLLSSNGAFILRPVRVLETWSYFMPPADYLQRRYGGAQVLIRLRHFIKAALQTMRFLWDSLFFGMERYIRLKRLGRSASLANKLETDL